MVWIVRVPKGRKVGGEAGVESGEGEGAEGERGKGVRTRVLERELRTIGGRGVFWVGGRVIHVWEREEKVMVVEEACAGLVDDV